jgi:E-phenylitaconyl-CoA hydratase
MATESKSGRWHCGSTQAEDRLMDSPVDYHQDGHVVTITYNRPERLNAINGEMREGLNAVWERFRGDETAWVAIVTGAGRAFCAGADLKDGQGATGTFDGTFWEKPTINSFESGMELFKPVIAAVNGPCIGYGFTAVTFCDFVIAGESATFGFPEVHLGQPTIVGAIRLPKRLNWADAMELLLLGDQIDATRAHEMGVAWRVVPDAELMAAARALAERLCAVAPLATRASKEVATRTAEMGWIESVRFGETMRIVANTTEDAREGRESRVEGRPARWQGR